MEGVGHPAHSRHGKLTWNVEGVDHPCWKQTGQNSQGTWTKNKQTTYNGQGIANKEKTVEGVGHPTKGAGKYRQHVADQPRRRQTMSKDKMNGDRNWDR